MNLQQMISKGLKNQPDYTSKFTEEVKQIGDLMANRFRINIYHNQDMNYSHGQSINFFLSKLLYPIDRSDDANYQIKVWLSSKVKLYTIKVFENSSAKNVWIGTFIKLPEKLLNDIDLILSQNNFSRIDNVEKLNSIFNDFYTELDGKPANLFEILFSEID